MKLNRIISCQQPPKHIALRFISLIIIRTRNWYNQVSWRSQQTNKKHNRFKKNHLAPGALDAIKRYWIKHHFQPANRLSSRTVRNLAVFAGIVSHFFCTKPYRAGRNRWDYIRTGSLMLPPFRGSRLKVGKAFHYAQQQPRTYTYTHLIE